MKNIKQKGKNIEEKGIIFSEIIDTGWQIVSAIMNGRIQKSAATTRALRRR